MHLSPLVRRRKYRMRMQLDCDPSRSWTTSHPILWYFPSRYTFGHPKSVGSKVMGDFKGPRKIQFTIKFEWITL